MSADQSTDASPPSSAPAAATSVPVGADAEADAADTEYTDDSTSVCSGSDTDDADETAALPAMLDTLSPALSAAAQQLTRSTLCRIHRLAQVIRSGAYVVIVTGAGVSVASGIRTYRSGKDGLWNNYVYEWGTKRKFLSDPSGWYTNFWLKAHDPHEFLNAQPGPSHIAIAQIMKMYPNVRLITQNVDRLHLKSGVDPKRLVEVHGAVGLYRCSKSTCVYARTQYLENVQLEKDKDGNVIPPRCPACGSLVMPLALLFDEHYSSHTFFKNDTICDWLDRAETIVFVGTSFSVGITSAALHTASAWGAEVYSFNIEPQKLPPSSNMTTQLINATGPCEITLPILAHECGADARPSPLSSCLVQ